jgi:type IV secretory pathway VirD2 relaxase
MTRDDDFHVRLGRVRNQGRGVNKPFVGRVLASSHKAGGLTTGRRTAGRSTFGRGRPAAFLASRSLTDRSRHVVVKARVVRQKAGASAPLSAHLRYLRREGVTKDGEPARMFDANGQDSDPRNFAERCAGDRHHFRFIVSPDDALEMTDLRAFSRDLIAEMERDLGTKLDWTAVDHWNTEHPHVHVIVRGKGDDGRDLVISRDYISHGLRARAEQLVTLELGPRSDLEIRRQLDAQVDAERWTKLDRSLAAEAARNDQIVDLRLSADGAGKGHFQACMIGRMRKLERLGLTEPLGPARWRFSDRAEPTLRALGERDDIIKRIHRGLTEQRIERSIGDFALHDGDSRQVIGRLIAFGLDDELKESVYAVIDGVDGRVHHLGLPDLNAVGDATPGSIVELRRFEDAASHQRIALAVRSDLPLDKQVAAQGATWLDRQLVGREPVVLGSTGFGQEVREAMDARIEHLIGERLAKRQAQRVVFARDLLDTLRRRELEEAEARISLNTGLPYRPVEDSETVAGVYRQRLDLASGRFAMIDDSLGFSLVPWTPSLERHLGHEVSGIARAGRIEWSFGRKRSPSLD